MTIAFVNIDMITGIPRAYLLLVHKLIRDAGQRQILRIRAPTRSYEASMMLLSIKVFDEVLAGFLRGFLRGFLVGVKEEL